MSRDAASRSSGELVAALNEVLQALQEQPASDETVHTARKGIKRARAALRLLRAPLGEALFNRENTALRDAGRCLAPLRDAKSLVDAYEAFRDRHPRRLQGEPYDALALQLRARLDGQRRELERSGSLLQTCMELITTCREQVTQRHIDAAHALAIPAGLQRIYRKGRKTRALAHRKSSPHALHEWRKQVKYLSNALKVLDASRELRKITKHSDKLADRLGEDHDLAELLQFLGDPQTELDPGQRSELARLIEGRRTRLQKKAQAIGSKIYRKKPGRFLQPLIKKKRGNRVVEIEHNSAASK
ncbi:MAG: CHAD domain-containing protein [Burkholderiales bacterium]